MPSVSQSPYSTRSKPAKKWRVWLGPESGIAPVEADETTKLRNPVITRTPGHGLDSIELQYDLGGENERIVDSALESQFTRQVTIIQDAENKGDPPILVAWGDIAGEGKSVAGGEGIVVHVSVMPYHFGEVMKGPVYRDPATGHAARTHHDQIVFNPEVDGIIEANRSLYSDTAHVKYKHWVHPDSVRTATAKQYAQDSESPELWDLPNVINTLCWLLNPDEYYIKNPSNDDLTAWLADAPAVRDVKLPTGRHLNEYLDAILTAHGYGWRLDYEFNDEMVKQVSIVIFSLNSGKEVDLYQQRPGDTAGAKFTQSNVVEFDLETEIVSGANEIICRGGRKLYEITVELYRGWPETDDSLTADALTQSTGASYATHQRAWRLWVANEGGDYCSTRATVRPIPSTPLDLSSILGANSIAKRRRALDCLTHFKDDGDNGARRRRPVFAQWYNVEEEWKPLPDGWGETVLEDQIGIYFAADEPPDELIARGNDARIRITFTVEADECLESTATKTNDSPNGRTNQLLVDVSDRYQYRHVQTTGDHLSVLAGVPTADEKDDTSALATFATKLQSIEDVAVIRGTANLIGLHLQYKIGQIVKRIKGREISLNRKAKAATEKKYLQIVGIVYDFAAQSTKLVMEPIQEGHDMGWIRSGE